MGNTFSECKWCYGSGCNQCSFERKKWEEQQKEPIFTANPDNPSDMELLNEVAGKDAVEKAFGFDGGGIREIRRNAALASMKQLLRKQNS